MHYHTPKPFFRTARDSWFVQINGKQFKLGKDKEQAFKSYHKLMADPPTEDTLKPLNSETSPLVATLCDHFLEWVLRNRSAETYEWYRYRLQRFIDRYPDITPAELKPFHVEEWVDSYRLSTTSRRNYFRTIKRCLNWAERQGYIDKNPIEFLEVPSADRKDTYVSPEQFEELLTYVVDPFLRDLLVVTYTTGCRPQESLRVQCRHVELKNKRWVFPQKEAKCKKGPRIVYLTDDALSITKKLLDDSKPNQFLFRNNRGHSWTTEAVNCAFDRIQTRMGKRVLEGKGFVLSPKEITRFLPSLKPTRLIKGKPHTKTKAELRCEAKVKLMRKKAREVAPRYSLYALRHSWATNALQAGVDALTVAILMGHRDPSMLAKVYQHLQHNPEHMLEQARKAASGTIIESRKC